MFGNFNNGNNGSNERKVINLGVPGFEDTVASNNGYNDNPYDVSGNDYYGQNPEFNNGYAPQGEPINPTPIGQGNTGLQQQNTVDAQYTEWILDQIFGDRKNPNNKLGEAYSKAYHDVVFCLLYDGMSKLVPELNEAKAKMSGGSSAFDILALEQKKGYTMDYNRKGYSITFENKDYSITFYVGVSSRNNGNTPALDNFVFSTVQNENANYPKGIILDQEFISGFAPFLHPILDENGIKNSQLTQFLEEFPSIVLAITDNITNFLNQYGDDAYIVDLASSGILEFGGIAIYPDIDYNNGIYYRMELSNNIRYKLKTDINFSEQDDRKQRLNYKLSR